MTDPLPIALENVEFFLRNVRTRMPFKYGKASLVAAPVLHVRATVAGEGGNRVEGYSADVLPPKWFDKDPDKDFRQNVEDLLAAAKCGARAYLAAGDSSSTFFEIWKPAYAKTIERTGILGLNELTGSFASTLMERALLDALAKLSGANLSVCLRENRIGLDPGAVHEELRDSPLDGAILETPPSHVAIRHTVGLADPIWEEEIPEGEKLNDGLPQSLETWIRDCGIRFFKIKVTNNLEFDRPRLERVANLLEKIAPSNWAATLDGNETFRNIEELRTWLEKVSVRGSVKSLLDRLLYIEQPLERSVAFQPDVESQLRNFEGLAPVLIDESDDAMGTFKRAAEIGYRGVSVKNCKGVLKGLLNKMLIDLYNKREGGGYILAGEDLMNLPVVPVQQDLASANLLGLEHVERNGHNYCRGLDHLSERERKDCLERHPNFYEPFEGSGRLRIQNGSIDVRSLHGEGFGSCMKPDFDSLTPLDDWSFDSMEEGE